MKKSFKLVSMLALAGSVFFSSCNKDDEAKPAPSVSIDGGNKDGNALSSFTSVTASSGNLITLQYTATTGENITTIDAKFSNGSSSSSLPGFPKTSGFTTKTSHSGSVSYTVSAAGTLSITVTDSKGATASKSLVISIPGAIQTSSATLLGSQSNANPGFFASSTGTAYSSGTSVANASSIDITYAELGTPTVTPYLLSAVERSTAGLESGLKGDNGGTATYFKVSALSSSDFDDITDDSFVSALTVTASNSQKVAVSSANTVYEFLNNAGKKGLIKVTTFAPGTSSPNGSITITTKVQK